MHNALAFFTALGFSIGLASVIEWVVHKHFMHSVRFMRTPHKKHAIMHHADRRAPGKFFAKEEELKEYHLFETSFMPGREFESPADFDAQFGEWLTIANARIVRTIKARPIELLDADRAAMLPLPPVPPAVGWVNRVRLGRDYYVRIDSNDYSVDPSAIGRFVDITAGLSEVRVTCAGQVVATHERCWDTRRTITDPTHVATAAALRQAYRGRSAAVSGPAAKAGAMVGVRALLSRPGFDGGFQSQGG